MYYTHLAGRTVGIVTDEIPDATQMWYLMDDRDDRSRSRSVETHRLEADGERILVRTGYYEGGVFTMAWARNYCEGCLE